MIRIACIQQVDFEGLGAIALWAQEREATYTLYHADENELPPLDSFDLLIILGGPMSIKNEEVYPWLKEEKMLIRRAITADKYLFGICLGAQLISEALGGTVIQSPEKEIGVYPLTNCAPRGHANTLASALPQEFLALHWHGEMFTIPEKALHFAASKGCPNQGFIYDNRVVALQYHLEATKESVRELIAHGTEDLALQGPFIQDAEEIVELLEKNTKKIRGQLYVILDTLLGRILVGS